MAEELTLTEIVARQQSLWALHVHATDAKRKDIEREIAELEKRKPKNTVEVPRKK